MRGTCRRIIWSGSRSRPLRIAEPITLSEYMVFWPSGQTPGETHQTGPRWQWQQDGQPRDSPAASPGRWITRPPRAQAPQPGRTSGYIPIRPSPDATLLPRSVLIVVLTGQCRRNEFFHLRPWGQVSMGGSATVRRLTRQLAPGVEEIGPRLGQPAGRGEIVYGIRLLYHLDTLRQIAYQKLAKESAMTVRYVEALKNHHVAGTLLALEGQQTETQAYLPTRRRSAKRSSPMTGACGVG